ncbi:MAG: helix-turn-helix domain-containing protein [Myxococcaceae bacterium]
MKRFEDMSPWEILGLEPGTSALEVRHAYEKLYASLAPGSLALYSLAGQDEQRVVQQQIRVAYLTLMHELTGMEYPLMPEPSHTPVEPAVEPPAEERSGAPEAAAPPDEAPAQPQVEFTGEQLRKVREGLGLTLAAIAQRTRIRQRQLESIEAEEFGALPQRVFVRGFVMAYARELHLDPDLVWASYGKRFGAATG